MPDESPSLFTPEVRQRISEFAYPFLTEELPGIGGRIKVEPADFIVEEIPLYEPGGEGEHLYLWIEKEDISGPFLTQHLSRQLGIPVREIGMAGLKDRRAVTRQYVSVPATVESKVAHAETDTIRILSTKRHTNKLKTAHLQGNRFSILIREVADDAVERAEVIGQKLQAQTVPNYFGPQRFGHEASTLERGLALLEGDRQKSLRGSQARLALSAVQSWLFNEFLQRRLQDGLFDQVLEGDVMQVRQSGGPFVVEDREREQFRYEQRETLISGPLFGPKMKSPQGAAADREQVLLQDFGLTAESFRAVRKFCPGARRALNLLLDKVEIQPEPEGIRFQFVLPPGSYATVVLREFMKVGSVE